MRGSRGTALALAMSFVAAACGEGSPPLPTAPSDSTSGATISGTVTAPTRSAAATSPWSPVLATALAALDAVTLATPLTASAGSGITVTVVGTNISVVLSESGKFALTQVPVGNIQLRFSGPGTAATLTINGVTNEHVQLVVKLEGSSATLESFNRIQAGNRAELEGLISSISYGGRSLRVANVEVKVGDVAVRHGSTSVPFTALVVGQRVHVKGTMENNHVVAQEVFLQNASQPPDAGPLPNPSPPGPPNDSPRVELRGFLSGFSGSCPGVTFSVDGRAVTANSTTSFRHGPCEHLENGTWIQGKGIRQANGSVLAEKIEMKEREFTGTIASKGGSCPTLTLVVNGITVKTDAWTSFEKLACGGFVTNVRVGVKGTEHPNGVVKAIRLKYEGE